MSDFHEMRWGTAKGSTTRHAIHPETKNLTPGEAPSLCNLVVLDEIYDEPNWDQNFPDACGTCRKFTAQPA